MRKEINAYGFNLHLPATSSTICNCILEIPAIMACTQVQFEGSRQIFACRRKSYTLN